MSVRFKLRTQVAAILLLVVLWFVVVLVSLFGDRMGLYIEPFRALSFTLPIVLPILGITLIVGEGYQRSEHPLLLYGGAAASILPFAVGTIWIYVQAYSSN